MPRSKTITRLAAFKEGKGPYSREARAARVKPELPARAVQAAAGASLRTLARAVTPRTACRVKHNWKLEKLYDVLIDDIKRRKA